MSNLPYGWTDQYAIRYLLNKVESLEKVVEGQRQIIGNLESEVARLDVQKANRAGRKPIARGETRVNGETL